MIEIHHLNCVKIVSSVSNEVCGHCLLLNENGRLLLIDTGIGLLDTRNPTERIGQHLIDLIGYRFDENLTAIRQIDQLGLDPAKVTDCIVSHLDNDHIGGLADFPDATVHVGAEELDHYHAGNPRYLKTPLAHRPVIKTYAESTAEWFGLEARKIEAGTETAIYLIPLFGHTAGHCGVALKIHDRWLWYIADAYYLKAELYDQNHPVNDLARRSADNNASRIDALNKIRRLVQEHPEIEVFSYHDPEEFRHYSR